jgi:hypothetical protein
MTDAPPPAVLGPSRAAAAQLADQDHRVLVSARDADAAARAADERGDSVTAPW